MDANYLKQLKSIQTSTPLCGPEHLEIEIINTCNLRCVSCWFFSPLSPRPSQTAWKIPVSLATKVITQAKALGVKSLCIPGLGEPTLHPGLPQILTNVKRAGLHLHLATNLTCAQPATLKALRLCDHIDITLLADNAKDYARLQSNGDQKIFHRVITNLQYLAHHRSKTRQRIYTVFIPTKYNADRLEKAARLAKNIGIDGIRLQPFDTTPHNRTIALSDARARALLKEAESLRHKDFSINTNYFKQYYAMKKAPSCQTSCLMGYFTLLVGIRGDVRAGCFSPDTPVIGNIIKEPLRNIWFSARAQRVRDQYQHHFHSIHLNGPCCPFLAKNITIANDLKRIQSLGSNICKR